MKYLLKLFKRRDFLILLIVSLVAIIIANGLSLTFPLLLSKIMDHYFASNAFLASHWLLVAELILIAFIASLLQNFFFNLLSEKIAYELRQQLIEKITTQPERYFLHHQTNKLLTILTSDVNLIRHTFGRLASMIITIAVLLIGSSSLMFSLNFSLSLIIMLSVLIVLAILFTAVKQIKKIFQKNRKIRDKLNKIINENVKGAMLIRVFVAEELEKQKFTALNTNIKQVGLAMTNKMSLVMPAVNFINLFASLLIFSIGGRQVIDSQMTLGEMSVFSNYVMMFVTSLLMLGMMSTLIGQALVSLKRMVGVLTTPSEFNNGRLPIQKITSLKFKDVSLKINQNLVLNKINFEIKPGEQIAIMGLTGAGKSLFLQLIIRLIDPTEGQILLNNQPLHKYDINQVRNLISTAFQDSFLFNDTLKHNINFGRDLTKQQTQQAAEIALVTEFSSQFKQKLNYGVGENGRRLSGGQKQRVNIARALAGQPQLIILDDVTSNLDVATEQQIITNIKTKLNRPAMIMISQKISSVKNCDRLYIMEHGQFTAVGTHQELLKKSALYQEIELIQQNIDSTDN